MGGGPEPALTDSSKNWCLFLGDRRPGSNRLKSVRMTDNIEVRTTKLFALFYVGPPIVVHINCVFFAADQINANQTTACVRQNNQIWLRRFKDKRKNVRWPRFSDHALQSYRRHSFW